MSVLHEIPLVSTIAVGLGMAFACGFFASKLRLSPIVGYLLAGVIIGPYSPGFIADTEIAEQLSEIGVVLLLFGVGLHFSIQDFMEVRKIASAGALLRMLVVGAIGIAFSKIMGWSLGTGIIFGLCLSVASTVVMLRGLEHHNMLSSMTGKISIGWLIVEDIVMVLALVMMPVLAAGSSVDGSEGLLMPLAIASAKILLFAAIMVIAGRRILPWVLTAVARTGSRELFTLAAISMAMGIALGATMLFGVSLALGAFFAGMMIRESDLNHEVASRILPFQDAFAVLFFVAVGMLFNPAVLIESPLAVINTVLIIILAKAVLTFGIVRSFGYPTKTSLLVGVGLAQIGEFSFILIALGASLGVMPEEARSIILAGALISIALNPFLFQACRDWCIKRGMKQNHEEEDALFHLQSAEKKALKNLIILVGAGNTGKNIVAQLDHNKHDLVIIDQNREKIEQLRAKGSYAIAGNATDKETLIEAGIEKAYAVLITIPDPFESLQVAELVRAANGTTRILVRSRNDDENKLFEAQDIEMTVSATEEVARRMVSAL